MKILIVEDEIKFLEILKLYFEKEGFKVFTSDNGEKAIEIVLNNEIDCIILDRMLPGISGDDVLKKVREIKNIPVLMLTAKGSDQDKIEGLLLGSDDYVVKPVTPYEIILRVRAILKRTSSINLDRIIYKDLELDRKYFLVKIGEEKIDLTKAEFEILYKLAQNPKVVFTRDQLIDAITPDGTIISDRTIDTHIKNIRKKLRKDYIKTVFGLGYKIDLD
ncbi:MAG: response regulator transcription factor [Spirochaetales bacterium]|jgi:two-component system OmpR family response regulator|nr:response regulator transcription factor [Exilispira sp.]NMC67682.1 response regulator transcription factor [Spirochaetales bacterium]